MGELEYQLVSAGRLLALFQASDPIPARGTYVQGGREYPMKALLFICFILPALAEEVNASCLQDAASRIAPNGAYSARVDQRGELQDVVARRAVGRLPVQ